MFLLVRRIVTVCAETVYGLVPVDEMLCPMKATESIIVSANMAVVNFFILVPPLQELNQLLCRVRVGYLTFDRM